MCSNYFAIKMHVVLLCTAVHGLELLQRTFVPRSTLITFQSLVSSANDPIIAVRISSSISSIIIRKSKGPRTDPCGTPELTQSVLSNVNLFLFKVTF